MTSSTRAFLAGVGTTFLILTAGFGGGLMLAKKVMEPVLPAPSRSLAKSLPPARVVLPASAEAAAPPVAAPAPDAAPQTEAVQPQAIPIKEAEQPTQRDRQAERSERRKAEAEERERRKRTVERQARREAARLARQQPQGRQQPGIMAFGGDNEQSNFGAGLFGN